MTRKLLTLLLMMPLLLSWGCGRDSAPAADARPAVSAGVPPVAFLVKEIAGDTVQVKTILPEGRTPHDYTPGPGDLRSLGRSKLFFSAGMPFEKKLLHAFSKLTVVDVGRQVHKLPLTDGRHHHDKKHEDSHRHHDHDHDHGDGLDPHIWLNCENAILISEEICDALVKSFPEQARLYRANQQKLAKALAEEETLARQTLAPWKGRAFFVYHPAFGYYAHMTGLRQIGVELDGREVSPARLAEVVREAKRERVRTIFVQPQFNPTAARMLAQSIGGTVEELDPLAADVIANLHQMTQLLYRAFAQEKDQK